jgi:hypothetical protein
MIWIGAVAVMFVIANANIWLRRGGWLIIKRERGVSIEAKPLP